MMFRKIIRKNLVYIQNWISAVLECGEIKESIEYVTHDLLLIFIACNSAFERMKWKNWWKIEEDGNMFFSGKMRWAPPHNPSIIQTASFSSCKLSTELMLIEGSNWTRLEEPLRFNKIEKNEKKIIDYRYVFQR